MPRAAEPRRRQYLRSQSECPVAREPSTYATTITVVPYTATIVVLEGPTCNEGYNWWRVRTRVVDVVYEGWIAESARAGGAEYVNVPRQPDRHAPLRLDIGGQALGDDNDDNSEKRLRSAPTVNSGIIAELIENVPRSSWAGRSAPIAITGGMCAFCRRSRSKAGWPKAARRIGGSRRSASSDKAARGIRRN